MKNVRVAFDIKEGDERALMRFQEIRCLGIFDVKMDGFARKHRMVAGAHTTEAPKMLTCANAVFGESTCVVLTALAAMSDLKVKAVDTHQSLRRHGLDSVDSGEVAVIVRVLHGLKSARASFRNNSADCLRELGHVSCKARAHI